MSSRTKIIILLLVLFAIIAIYVSNCSGGRAGLTPPLPGDTPPGDPGEYYEPSDNLKNVDDMQMDLKDIQGDEYTFSYTGSPPDIKVGDILSGSYDGGFLRRVTSVVDTGSELIILTVQASIDDALDDASLSTTVDIGLREGAARRAFPAPSGTGYLVPLTGEVIYAGDGVTLKVVDGDVQLDADIGIEMHYDINQGLTDFTGKITGNVDWDFDVKVIGDGDIDLTKEKLVHTSPQIPFQIGPIWGAVIIRFYAGIDVDGNIDGYLVAGVEDSLACSLGAEYSDGTWTPVTQINNTFAPGTVAGNADGEAILNGYVRPEATVLFAGVPGPTVACESVAMLTGTGQLSPPCLIYDLSAGLTCEVVFLTDILGDPAPYSAEILNIEELIASGSVGECEEGCQNLLVNAISGPEEIDGGGVIEYSVNASGDTGITYQWSCEPSIKGHFTNGTSSRAEFHPIQVDSPKSAEIRVLVKSDGCPSGVTKTKQVRIVNSGCPYNVSAIMGAPFILEQTTGIYSVMVSSYSIQGMTYNWTCDPANAGYFLSNDVHIVEFFANAVDEDTAIKLEVVVDSDECDPVAREKQVTIEDDTPGTG